MSTVAVVGLGRIGCITAGCLAELGHRVWGVDVDESRLACISAGRAPFREDGLEPILQQAVAGGRLTVTADLQQALAESSLAMLCLNTDLSSGGGVDLSGVLRVIDGIAEAHRRGSFKGTIVLRSTVPPGTCEEVLLPRLRTCGLPLVANPEFLREGHSVRDFMEPSLIVIGGDSAEAMQSVSDLYAHMGCGISIVGLREAEVIKYACNVFHALKIAFSNEIASLCNSLGIDGKRVMHVLGSDARLNASAAYLKPGFAFGGYCLPKDTKVLNACATKLGIDLPLLRAILPSNDGHLQRAVDTVVALGVSPVGVYGISFKGGTDDLRDSPALALVEALVARGTQVRVYDPMMNRSPANSAGSVMKEKIRHLMPPDFDSWLRGIGCAVMTQGADPETVTRLQESGIPVLDLS